MSTELGIEPEVLKAIYRQMVRIRAVDAAIQDGLSSGRFKFSYWPMTGQEAIPATLAQLVDSRDYMLTTFRGLHDQIAKGVPLTELFAEALGRGGINKGKGGTAHLSDPESGAMLTTAIVGGGAPIATGLALASRLRGEQRVTVVNIGDGATSIGAVHEAMNLAGVWRLPVIFLCQNNQFAEFSRVVDYTANADFASRAAGYGFAGCKLDGNDPEAFYTGMKSIVETVRSGGGPIFVEAATLRLGGHSGVGDNPEATTEELRAGKAAWPVPRTRARLLSENICSETELAALETAAAEEVELALTAALRRECVSENELLTDVFADPNDIPRRGHYKKRASEAEARGATRSMTMAEAVCHAQELALQANPEVFLLGEDIGDPLGGVFGTTRGLETKFGKQRVRSTPIAEQAIIGAGMGAALAGMRPVAELLFNDFMTVCMDQLANHVAKQRYVSGGRTPVPLTIRMMVGGGIGGFGAQHSQSLEAWLLHTPGLKVAYPSTPYDAKGLLLSCIHDNDPCVHMESILMLLTAREEVPVMEYRIPLGVAKVRREGWDITLISYGWQVQQCLLAADELQKHGISAEVIDLRTLVPLDYQRVFDSVKKTRRALVVHAATEFCGFGAELASSINEELFSKLKGPALRFGAVYAPVAHSREMESRQLPNAHSIVERVRAAVAEKKLARNYRYSPPAAEPVAE